MSLSPDPAPPSAPQKTKLTREQRLAREADRLMSIYLRMAISRKLDEQGITDPHAIASAFGMPVLEANKLLMRVHWREGDVALLKALAARLGVQMPDFKPRRL